MGFHILLTGFSSSCYRKWLVTVLFCDITPVNAMVRLVKMDSNTILGVVSLHCLFVLAESHHVCTESSFITPSPPFLTVVIATVPF